MLDILTLVAQSVKNLPAMQESWVRSLDLEEPLEKETATHSRILVWEIQWTEEPGGLQSMGIMRVRHDLGTKPQCPKFICLERALCPIF